MNGAELAVAGDENLAQSWMRIGWGMGCTVVEDDGLALVASGLPIAFFNGAFLRSAVADPEQVIRRATDFFAERELPWLMWIRDALAPDLIRAGEAAGLRRSEGPPAMGLHPMREFRPLPAELEIEIVRTPASLGDHAKLLSEGFGFPREVADQIIRPALLEQPGVTVVVGRVAGEPVSTALSAVTDATAGVYNVATPERFRGKGYGEAMTAAAIAAGAGQGCTHSVLQASAAGYPIYQRMGFATLGHYVQLEGPARPAS